jgi:hypothetical protein
MKTRELLGGPLECCALAQRGYSGRRSSGSLDHRAFCVLLAGVIQIYRLERGAGKKSGSVRPASAEPKVTDDSPSGVLGWCLIGLIWIVAMSILLAIIGFVLYGFYLVGMSWWDQYLDLFAEPPVR